jgi:hypothetical protein
LRRRYDDRLYHNAGRHHHDHHHDHSRTNAPGLLDHDHGDDELDELRPNHHRDQLHIHPADGHFYRHHYNDPVESWTNQRG